MSSLGNLMKKFILILIIFLINISIGFAAIDEDNLKEDLTKCLHKILYEKPEISNTKANNYKEFIISKYKECKDLYFSFTKNKNNMEENSKYEQEIWFSSQLIRGFQGSINVPFFEIGYKYNLKFDEAIPYTEKDEEDDGINWNFRTLNYIKDNYLKKYNLSNIEELDELQNLISETAINLDIMATEIKNYSIEYENKKLEDLKKNYKSNNLKISSFPLPYDLYTNHLSSDVIYRTNPEVLQLFSDGFTADTDTYNQTGLIFVKANDSKLLLNGDCFDPFLPVHFTGKYKNYENIYGEITSVPVFEIIMREYNPFQSQKFYFIQSPTYKYKELPEHIYVINERRAIYNGGNPYAKYR